MRLLAKSHDKRIAWIAGLTGLVLGAVPVLADPTPPDPARVPPKPIYRPEPEFPVYSAASGGYCKVEYAIGIDGSTSDAKIVLSHPYEIYDTACLAAIARWKFQPATVAGQPVAVRVSAMFTFHEWREAPDPQTSYLKPGQWVTLDYTLKRDGSAVDVEATGKSDEHTNTIQAVRQLRRMHFAPILENGVAVEKPHQSITIGNKPPG